MKYELFLFFTISFFQKSADILNIGSNDPHSGYLYVNGRELLYNDSYDDADDTWTIEFSRGTSVKLVATTEVGWEFIRWDIDAFDMGGGPISMNQDGATKSTIELIVPNSVSRVQVRAIYESYGENNSGTIQ